jgi:hypothetical protein
MDHMNGTDFITGLHDLPLGPARAAAIFAALPSRVLWPMVDVPIVDAAGKVRGSFQASADYFAIGTVDDFVRVPLDGPTAQKVADELGLAIPTPRMVGLIHRAAAIRIQPILRAAAPEMTSVAWFVWHSKAIDAEVTTFLAAHPEVEGDALLSDVKKNVVLSNARVARPSQLALFGEHVVTAPIMLSHADGSPRRVGIDEPIQTLTLFHEAGYADESHGFRACGPSVVIDGESYTLEEALQNSAMAGLLSDEGPLAAAAMRYA